MNFVGRTGPNQISHARASIASQVVCYLVHGFDTAVVAWNSFIAKSRTVSLENSVRMVTIVCDPVLREAHRHLHGLGRIVTAAARGVARALRYAAPR